MLKFDSTIEDYALENYWGIDDAQVSHFKKRKERLAKMTDEERTARRKKFQKILKIGVALGAVGTLIAFGPEIMAALAPVFPAMKAGLKAKGIDVKNLKVGQVAEKFSTEVAGKPIPESGNAGEKAMKVAKNILGYFASAKKRKDEGTATELEKALVKKADEITDKISKTAEKDAVKTLKNILTSGTADEGETIGAEVSKTKEGTEGSESTGGMDIKKYLPIALVVLGIIFFVKRG